MGRWTTRSFPTLLKEMTKLKDKEDRTKQFFLPSLGDKIPDKGEKRVQGKKPKKEAVNRSDSKTRHRFASSLGSDDVLPKLHKEQPKLVEQADEISQSLSQVPEQQGFDFTHDINPGNHEKYFGEVEKYSGGDAKEGGRHDRRRKQLAAELSAETSNPLIAASNDVEKIQYSARRAIAGISHANGDDDDEPSDLQPAVEWVGGSLVPTTMWRKQISDNLERLSPTLEEADQESMVIPQEILDLIPESTAKDSDIMQEMIDVYVKNSPRSKQEAARSGKVPMEILEYEDLFRKMTHSARLLFHLGGRHALPIDHRKFRCHSIVAAEARSKEQLEGERQARLQQEREQQQQQIRKQMHARGDEANKKELKRKIQREMENMDVKCFCARRETARETFLSPRRIAERVRREGSPAPGAKVKSQKPEGQTLMERRQEKSSLGGSTRVSLDILSDEG